MGEDGIGEGWQRHGWAMIRSMAEVLEEATDDHNPVLLETADYWPLLGSPLDLDTRARLTASWT
jgi:hypothetical protein